jgi:branched-chain amino acid transport system substrate-binding protein
VYLAGFEEVADVFNAARTVTGLDGVRWYGGDGSAQSKALLASGPATFATSARVKGYPSPLVGLPAGRAKRDAKLLSQISKRAKNPADAFTLAAYDAFNVAARALAETSADTDPATLRLAFATAAQGAKGVTGTIRLDAAGDRVSTPYAFWSICQRGKTPRWTETGTWTPASDPTAPGRVSPKSCPKR